MNMYYAHVLQPCTIKNMFMVQRSIHFRLSIEETKRVFQ